MIENKIWIILCEEKKNWDYYGKKTMLEIIKTKNKKIKKQINKSFWFSIFKKPTGSYKAHVNFLVMCI